MSTKHKQGKYQKVQPVTKKKVPGEKIQIHLTPWQKRVLAYILAIVLLITVPVCIQTSRLNARHEEEIAQIAADYEDRIIQLQQEHEAEILALNQEHEYGGNISEIEREAEYISKVVYGMGRNHSVNDQKAIVWCILNRVESAGFPSTIAEVCHQSQQWIGYSDDNPVLTEIYDMVLPILKNWHNNAHRPMDKSYVYLSWSSDEILLRDTFEVTKTTHYYRFY
jgi:hypothetical protein